MKGSFGHIRYDDVSPAEAALTGFNAPEYNVFPDSV